MKPHNVLMAGSVPRITDFGIGSVVVQPTDGVTGALTAFAARLPSALHNAGTRLYAPPEQLFGSTPNPRDDVYALGIIAYQMVLTDLMTGPGADATLVLLELKIPSELSSLIIRSAALDPNRRPKDATEWETTLARIIEKARKTSDATDTSEDAVKPAILPVSEPVSTPKEQTPQFGANDFQVAPPEPPAAPTDVPLARIGPRPLPPPLPRRVAKPAAEPVWAETPPAQPDAISTGLQNGQPAPSLFKKIKRDIVWFFAGPILVYPVAFALKILDDRHILGKGPVADLVERLVIIAFCLAIPFGLVQSVYRFFNIIYKTRRHYK